VALAEASVPVQIVTHHAPPLGACHVAALVEVAIGTYHTAGVPVTVIPPILVESHAVRPEAIPVTFVITPLAGVPRAGEVRIGLVRVLFVRVSVLEIVGTFTPPACSLPVPFGTMFTFISVLEPVAVSVIVPVPPATW